MSVGYVSYAAPVASSPATLGVTNQPTVAPASGGSPNARVATGYSSTPVTGGGGYKSVPAPSAQPAAPTANQQAATSAVAGQFGSQMGSDFASASGGGMISSLLDNGISKITAFAQNGMKSIEQAMQGDMAANNGQIDPAKMQQYTMQMTTFQTVMQMAAKIQEKQEAAVQAWLR